MRRPFLALVGAFLVFTLGLVPALAAQDATPESEFDDLGWPALNVTVTADAYEGIPNEIEAGRYLVTLTATEDTEFGGGVAFVQPEGMTPEEFLSAAAGPPDVAGEAPGGTPEVAAVDATPAEGEGMGGPPDVFFDFTFAGGIFARAGFSAQVVLDLTPGEWVAWGDEPAAPQEPVVFSVTGEMPSDLVEPESSATLTMDEYVIDVTEGELVAGQQVLKIENIGAQPHFVFIARGPDGMTEEQVQAVLDAEIQAEMTGTPPAYADLPINPEEDFMDVLSTGTQSTDTEIWVPVDLQPGTYLMICFFPDRSDGLPHAVHGMYNVVEVSE